jgi:hypothetical protein
MRIGYSPIRKTGKPYNRLSAGFVEANRQVVGLAFGESLGTGKEALSTTALQWKG